MPGAITALANTTLGSGTSSVTFSSISSSYKDLMLVISNFSTTSDGMDIIMRFNSDTGNNYSQSHIRGNGSTPGASAVANITAAYPNFYSILTTSNVTNIIHILDYSATDKHKSMLVRAHDMDSSKYVIAGTWRWASTSAINTISLAFSGINATSGSTLTLYGVSA